MIALIIIGLAAVIAIGMVWSRVGLARSERRSMQNYRHSLDVLGGVSRKSGQAAPIRQVPPERASLGHIRAERPDRQEAAEPRPPVTFGQTTFKPASPRKAADDTAPKAPAVPPGAKQPASPTVPPPVTFGQTTFKPASPRKAAGDTAPKAPAVPPGSVQPARPRTNIGQSVAPTHFEDDSDAFEQMREREETETVVAFAGREATEAVRRPATRQSTRRPRSREGWDREALSSLTRRVATMAAVAVVLAAVSLGAIQLTGNGSKSASRTTTKGSGPAASGHHHHHRATPTTTTPSALVPVSTSSTEVAFVAPKGKYTVKLSDTGGTCWVGIQQTSGGPYVWQETLYAGQDATYKASGPLVIRIGAPRYLGVTVNGLPARLPGYVQPYDVVFNPASPPSSA